MLKLPTMFMELFDNVLENIDKDYLFSLSPKLILALLKTMGVCVIAIGIIFIWYKRKTSLTSSMVGNLIKLIPSLNEKIPIRVLSKGYLTISLLPPLKLEKILREVRIAIAKSNKDYDLVLTRLYLYYDTKLVTFGIDNQRNMIVQFPVFVQPYTQKRLIMYQIETVSVPILDEYEQVHSYTELKIEKMYIDLNEEMYITLCTQELKMCKKIG